MRETGGRVPGVKQVGSLCKAGEENKGGNWKIAKIGNIAYYFPIDREQRGKATKGSRMGH